MIRIRYRETATPGILESTCEYISKETGGCYRVYLDLNTVNYKIINVKSRLTFTHPRPLTNINVLKRLARRKLQELKIKAVDEKRNRTFGRCEKGYTQKKYLEEKGWDLVEKLLKNSENTPENP